MTKIALGADHAGYRMKEAIKAHLQNEGYEIVDFGTGSEVPVDYPDYCRPVAKSVVRGDCECGVVFGYMRYFRVADTRKESKK